MCNLLSLYSGSVTSAASLLNIYTIVCDNQFVLFLKFFHNCVQFKESYLINGSGKVCTGHKGTLVGKSFKKTERDIYRSALVFKVGNGV